MRTRLPNCAAMRRSASGLRSTTTTSAPMPAAMKAAFVPATPPPRMTTLAAGTPGTPPSSTPRPPFSFSRQCAPTCGAMRPGDLRHRHEQRQSAMRRGHRLVGDRRHAALDQVVGLLRIGGEMQIREQDLSAPQQLALVCQRLLYFHHQLGVGEDLLGAGDELRAGGFVLRIGEAGAQAGTRLNQNAVALGRELVHGRRHKPHAIFVVFDFLGNADQHGKSPRRPWARRQ